MLNENILKEIGIKDISWTEILNNAFKKNNVKDRKEIAMFLAQTTHESNNYKNLEESFRYTPQRLLEVFDKRLKGIEEAKKLCLQGAEAIANFVYGGRLGNAKNEGYKFRGRGIIQLTGKNNYSYYGKKLGIDLVNNPDLAKEKNNAVEIAFIFWKEKGCGLLARKGDLKGVTKLINGGSNGLEDRIKRYYRILELL